MNTCKYCTANPAVFPVASNKHMLSGIACANIFCAHGFVLPVRHGEDPYAIWAEANKGEDKGNLEPLSPCHPGTIRSSTRSPAVARSFVRWMTSHMSPLQRKLVYALVFQNVSDNLGAIRLQEDYSESDINVAHAEIHDYAVKLRRKLIRFA